MALLGNYSVLYKSPGYWRGGGATGQGLDRPNFNTSGAARNQFTVDAIDPKSAFPSGYILGYALVPAQRDGGLAASNTIYGSATFAGGGQLGRNGAAALSGAGDIDNAALALVLSAVSALTGSGALTGAIAGRLDAAAALSGDGDVAAALGAIASLVAPLAGAGEAADTSSLKAKGSLAAEIVVTGDLLTTANVAAAILDAIDAIESGVTLRQATRLILAATAGKASISGNTVTYRNAVADDTDRIVATTTTDGERTAITYDTE